MIKGGFTDCKIKCDQKHDQTFITIRELKNPYKLWLFIMICLIFDPKLLYSTILWTNRKKDKKIECDHEIMILYNIPEQILDHIFESNFQNMIC